jgi:hypothetical protein
MAIQDKIPVLMADKTQELLEFVVPAIVNLAFQIGMEKLDSITDEIVLPEVCIPAAELQKVLEVRNNIIDKLNLASQTIEILTKPVDALNTVVNVSSQALQIIDIAILAAEIAIPQIPTAPPDTPSIAKTALIVLNKTKDLKPPITDKINIAKNGINSITSAVDYIDLILSQIINLLNAIDIYLLRCGGIDPKDETKQLTSLNPYLTKVVQDANKVEALPEKNELYQGFLLEIIEEPYSSTVNRRKAVARNKDNIILLQTPLSFTTDTQVLFTELKLIINKNNLKAY